MTNQTLHQIKDDAEEKPLDPAVERVRQKMMRFMMVAMGLTFTLVAVVAGIALYRFMKSPGKPATASLPVVPDTNWIVKQLALPAGTRVTHASLDGSRALVTLETEKGAALWLIDLETATVLKRIELAK